jgi:Golgi to ER traffic protein 4
VQEDEQLICRYIRVQDYDSAVQLLYIGGELLLENGLAASGADITITLIEVYNTAHLKPDSTSRGATLLFIYSDDQLESFSCSD